MLQSWAREDLLFLPPAFAVLSLAHVSAKWLKNPGDTSNNVETLTAARSEEHTLASVKHQSLKETVKSLDGFSIILFRLLRLLSILTLLSLEVFKLSIGEGSSARFHQVPFYSIASLFAILSIATPPRWRDVTSRQLALLLFAEFIVYFVLDVWPYATLNQTPFDPPSDSATWTRISLLSFSGVVVPLIMPRPFRALTPRAQPSLELTSSLLSRYTYSYLDAIVFYAYKVPDVTVADMPEVPEHEEVERLSKQAFPALDPVRVGKRHIIWGIIRVWGKDYALLALWLSLNAISDFAGPYGMKNLLEYLETGVSPHGLHSWVWIVMLTAGPLLSACLFTQYLAASTRVIIENTSVLTYLVFHHALRIRLKGDALDDKEEEIQKGDKKETDVSTRATITPATTDADTIVGSEDGQAPDSSDVATMATPVSDAEPVPDGGHAKEKTEHLLGKINTLITADLTAILNSDRMVAFPVAVLQLVLTTIVLYNLLGWGNVASVDKCLRKRTDIGDNFYSALVGFAILLLLSPAPMYIANLIAGVQHSKMNLTDKRVQAVTESLGILRMIKLFSWESYILKQLADSREKELSKMKNFRLLSVGMNLVNQVIPFLSKLITLSIYTLVSKGDLTASRIFAALMIFNMMEEQLFRVMYNIPELIRMKVSYDRFSKFLNSTELLSESNTLFKSAMDEAIITEQPDKDVIGFNACSFSWDSFGDSDSHMLKKHHGRKEFQLHFDTEVTFKRDSINLIVGPTASGKTSMLMALLGEMYCKPHGIHSWCNLPRGGGIAYAPQETWVLNETIRENILFGELYDEKRYKKVLEQCALQRDLDLWEAGDLTEVGEKGLTLSGGQKARVTLARALYSSASIILLDDVLAALDVHTAKWIVDKALKGDLIQGRTILLVTHNVALTAPVATHVIALGRHGNVSAQGPVSEILQKDSRLRAQVEKKYKEVEEVVEDKLDGRDNTKGKGDVRTEDMKKDAGKLVVAEEKAMGRVETAAVMLFVGGVGGPLIWTVLLGTKWAAMLVMIFQTWFVGYWSNQYASQLPSEVPALKYLGFYAFLNMSGYVFEVVSEVIWAFGSLRASRIIHFHLLESIFSSTFRWLDITPVGRIITRCTQDMSTIDEQLSQMASPFLTITINLICLFFAAVFMVGWYALIPGVLVTALGGLLGWIYLKCQICVRREMSNAKAPVMTQVGIALAGLSSIRAYGAQTLFHVELRKRIDVYARTSLTFYDINRWISIRIDSMGAIFAGVVSAYLVYGGKVEAGFAGFTLSVVLAFTRLILFWVRFYNMLEIQSNSLERMLEFMRVDHEPKPSESGKPPAYWPSSGGLRVEKMCARYSDNSPEILRDISFEVKSGERVGVVGKTGAGKSSVALALLRAIKTTGKVYYDGLATDEMNLDTLRSNITLIPQQPELIHGTLRENLDPFEQHDDASLNDALHAAGFYNMKELSLKQDENEQAGKGEAENGAGATGAEGSTADVQASAHTKIGLDAMVESGGANFSLGQRQTIALARAIIRRSKLLILDEATAAIDYDTDSAIQKTLRTEFSRDTTLITIAHRLQTIMDYDKIMVLDAGKVVEFDSPKELLKNGNGFLRALVDESDDREILINLAGFGN